LRILITISRDWDDYEAIEDALLTASREDYSATVVHGASHMDWFVAGVAWMLGLKPEPHKADWVQYSRRAGMIRNAEMVNNGADLCLAFIRNNSPGASHCASLAEKAGIPTQRFTRE